MSEVNKEERIRVRPVILSGGSGTRLWPLSRDELPKQFLPLLGTGSLFEATLKRVADRERFLAPLIVCGERHVGLVEMELARAGIADAKIIVEPVARNTAPALALAAILPESPEYQLVLPCDHHIASNDAFCAAIDQGVIGAAGGSLVTFGIEPDRPETGYGYIAARSGAGIRKVRRFIEKPDRVAAEQMVLQGGHHWNAGIFLWRSDTFLQELRLWAGDVHCAASAAMPAFGGMPPCSIRASLSEFARSPSISVDYAVMEKTARAMVVPVSMGWSDVGSWDSLYALSVADGAANFCDERGIALDCSGCYIRSAGPKVVAIGVEDLVVVVTNDVALIVPRSESQRVREAAAAFNAAMV